jgi:cysteine desulfuration protein SufE
MPSETADYPHKLKELIRLFDGLTRQERMELLLEFADRLPEVPQRLGQDTSQRQPVHECMTPTWIYVEPEGESARIYVEVAEEAPSIRAVATLIIEGCQGAPREQILAVSVDLAVQVFGPEMVGQRRYGLAGLISSIKQAVAALG